MIWAKNLVSFKGYQDMSQEKILAYYLGISEIKLGVLYKNPLREDRNPSAGFYYGNDVLFFHDFATGVHYSWASIVKMKYNVSYKEAMDIIRGDREKILNTIIGDIEEEDVKLEIVLSSTPNDYFRRYGIGEDLLKKFNVHHIKSVYRNGKLHSKATNQNPIFAYSFPSGRIKLYRPLSPDKTKKWYGNSSADDISGLHLCKRGRLLIITKSLKDCMVLHTMGIPAISFNGETVGTGDIPNITEVISSLKTRYERILILYDNDDAGIKAANKLGGKYGLRCVFLSKEKDISDLTYLVKRPKAWKLLKKVLSKSLRESTIQTPY